MNNRQKWALLAISYADKQGLTPAQLQKSLFLFQKAFGRQVGDFYEFTPYNYGPFDKSVYTDAEALITDKLVGKADGNANHTWSIYAITSAGKSKADELLGELDPKMSRHLKKIVTWAQGLSFQQLISTIYQHYPEYKVNSVFKD